MPRIRVLEPYATAAVIVGFASACGPATSTASPPTEPVHEAPAPTISAHQPATNGEAAPPPSPRTTTQEVDAPARVHVDPASLVRLKGGKLELGGGAVVTIPGRIRAAHAWKTGDYSVEITTPPPVVLSLKVPAPKLVSVATRAAPMRLEAKGKVFGEVAPGTEIETGSRAEGRLRAKLFGTCVPKFEFWIDEWALGPMAIDAWAQKPVAKGKQQLVGEDTVLYSAPNAKLFTIPQHLAGDVIRTFGMPADGYEGAVVRTDGYSIEGIVKVGSFTASTGMATCNEEAPTVPEDKRPEFKPVSLAADVHLFGDTKQPEIGVVSKGARVLVGPPKGDGFCEIVASTGKMAVSARAKCDSLK